MPSERDLSAVLPPSPPPRPNRREATIAAALRRFDGEPAAAAAPPHRWRLIGRPQFGALAAAALVAAIGLPLWLGDGNRTPMPDTRPAAVTTTAPTAASDVTDQVTDAPAAEAPATRAAGIVAAPVTAHDTTPGEPAVPAPPTEPRARAALSEAALAPVAVAPPPAAAPPPPPPPPPPPASAPGMASAEDVRSLGDIVVTGSRLNARTASAQKAERRAAGRGAWNACTIDDPRQDLAACRKGAPGSAAALVGDGLAKAWRDDLDGAMAAFDRAIAASPRLGSAWLNRGLARVRSGDDTLALTDLDQAVRYAPNDPRVWFQRSRVLRRDGKTARADADAARAAELDPRYEHVIDDLN